MNLNLGHLEVLSNEIFGIFEIEIFATYNQIGRFVYCLNREFLEIKFLEFVRPSFGEIP